MRAWEVRDKRCPEMFGPQRVNPTRSLAFFSRCDMPAAPLEMTREAGPLPGFRENTPQRSSAVVEDKVLRLR